MNKKYQYYWMAIRPRTLTAGVTPVIIGLSYSFYVHKTINILIAALTLLCTLLMQMGTNLVNDYFDYKKGVDKNRKSGPIRVTQEKLLSEKEVKMAYRSCLFLSFLVGLYLMMIGGKVIIILGLSSLAMAYLYTGGPLPLAYFGLGEILAFLFFGPVAVFGTYYLQNLNFNPDVIILGTSTGFLAAALMAINNLRDRKDDLASGKKTLANIFSIQTARFIPFICILLGSLIVPFYLVFKGLPFAVLVSILPFLLFKQTWLNIFSFNIDSSLNLILANIGKYMFIYGLLLSLGMHLSL
ncbi:MAG: 1,4-dihydroxy-2-naphthoate octaprenyltransferase [Bdellovibrionales bacterium]|nr:1,4-dihydroxy-2-naphthoate octaprenyltransferase [Bdellovibrionales bacterium]